MTKSKELGNFIKMKRFALCPTQFKIPVDNRRRVKGLRREEIADLAGVSVDWYVRIEQGRENVSPSVAVLNSLAKVLQLNFTEKKYLFRLADKMLPMENEPCITVSETLQKFLDSQNPSLAYVVDCNFTVIAWNDSAAKVYGGYKNASEKERNLVWRVFRDPYTKKILDDWEGYAKLRVAQLRTLSIYQNSALMIDIIEDLRDDKLFEHWWNNPEIIGTPEGQKLLHHPVVGDLYLNHITLETTEIKGAYVMIQMPIDDNTKTKLQQLIL